MRALPAFYAFRRISDDGRWMALHIQIWPTHFLMRKMRPNALKKARSYRQGDPIDRSVCFGWPLTTVGGNGINARS